MCNTFLWLNSFAVLICVSLSAKDYANMENVLPLTKENFDTTIKDGRWLVIFYNRNCGHCIAYSDTFSEFANLIKDWSWAVQVGSVDCATDVNVGLCRDFDIYGVPQLIYISKMTPKHGLIIKERKPISKVQDQLVNMLSKEDFIGNEGSLLIKSNSPIFNTRIILDYTKPMGKQIQSLVDTRASEITLANVRSGHIIASGSFDQVRSALAGMGYEPNKEKHENPITPVTQPTLRVSLSTQVYAADILRSLLMLMNTDVPLKRTIQGEDMDALKEFMNMLTKLLPFKAELMNLLINISDWLSGKHEITGVEWQKKLEEIQFPLHSGEFIACQGSKSYLRGYPCGLWIMFHSLTVQHYLLSAKYPDLAGNVVAHAMHRFIPRFFSCCECAFHFAANSANIARNGESLLPVNRPIPPGFIFNRSIINILPSAPTTATEEILWLNAVHNRVNKRLAGDPTEDPMAPKIVYPPKTLCPACWSTDPKTGVESFGSTLATRDALFSFLVTHYRPSSWYTDHVPSSIFAISDVLAVENRTSDLVSIGLISSVVTVLAMAVLLFIFRSIWRVRCRRRVSL